RDEFQHISVLVFLLPYIEQDNVWKRLQQLNPADYFNLDARGQTWYRDPRPDGNLQVGSTQIKTFLCPSAPDSTNAASGIGVRSHYAHRQIGAGLPFFVYADALGPSNPNTPRLGRTNYGGVAGLLARGTNTSIPGIIDNGGLSKYEGVFSNRSKTSLSLLTNADGSSNVLLFTEATGGSRRGQVPVDYAG